MPLWISRQAGDRLQATIRSNRPPGLICLGLSAFDLVWVVDEPPGAGQKIRAHSFHEVGGGMAANASVAAARLGASVGFWGRAGHDRAGLAMRDALAAEGVGVDHFRCFDGASSSVSGVIVDAQGERSIVNFRGADLPTDTGWLPLDQIRHAGAVLADPRWPEGALALFRAAREAGIPTILDGDVADTQVFDRILPLTDYAIFSAPGLNGYLPACSLRHADAVHNTADHDSIKSRVAAQLHDARSTGCRLAAVTMGADGVVWLNDDGLHHRPAASVTVVDTTGAGDVFHGAFAVAIACQLESTDAFGFATIAAAIKCTRIGGRAGAPDLDTVMQCLQSLESAP